MDHAEHNKMDGALATLRHAFEEWADGERDRLAAHRKAERARLRKLDGAQLLRERDKAKKNNDGWIYRHAQSLIASRSRWGQIGPDGQTAKIMNFRIDLVQKEKVEAAARLCKMTVSAFIRMAIENEIAELEKGN
jgi:hypothetical protein